MHHPEDEQGDGKKSLERKLVIEGSLPAPTMRLQQKSHFYFTF
jgi:hypothetical protein